MGRSESDRQVLEFFVIERQNGEIQILQLSSFDFAEFRIRKHFGQFDLAFTSAAAEHGRVAVLNIAVPECHRGQRIIDLTLLISFADEFREFMSAVSLLNHFTHA